MKYSFGITNSRHTTKPTTRRGVSHAKGLDKFNNFKKYISKNVGKKNVKKNPTGKSGNSTLKARFKKVLYIFIGIVFLLGCIGLIGAGIYLKNLQGSLPSPDQLVDRQSDQSTQIFDRNGTLLYTVYGNQNREFFSIDKVPDHTKWALLAAEDVEFYQHKGIDYMGILRSILRNLKAGSITGSGSTITQQLVKTTILYDVLGDEAYAQTYTRKIKEILITMQVEQTFSKDEILQMYMNEVPLGGVNYGFQAAANAYFGKDLSELSLAESALIAGLIQAPGMYSPLYGTNPDLAKERQTYVLDQMLKHKDLTGVTEEEIEAARNEELVYKTSKIDIKAPHFVFYVKQLLEEEYGTDRVERGGLKVTTSLDYSLQEIAEEEVIKGVESAKRYNVNNGSMVVMDPNNGQVLAMVGSVDYWNTEDPRVDGNVNIAVSTRPMGSSIKPFVYLTAVQNGYGPWTQAPDLADMKFGNYDPKNWDSKNMGTMTARKALVYSRNVPAVYMLQLAGIDPFLQNMEKVGVTTLAGKESYGLSLALGSGEEKLLEHTAAFAVLANGGTKYDTTPILKVEDSKGNVLKEVKEASGQRVFDEKDVYLVNWMLCDIGGFNDRPDNKYYTIKGKKVCGKTGTSDGPKDLTTVLYHKNLVIGVWNGNNNNKETPGGWGTNVPLPIANSFMSRVLERYTPELYNRPAGILSTTVCTDTGASPAEGVSCTKEQSVYASGKAPQSDNRKVLTICSANSLIASNADVASRYGLTETKTYMTKKLDNSLQQAAYEKFLGSKYLFTEPASGICQLPLGPDNAPLIDVQSPISGASLERGKVVSISGQVRYLESLSSFAVRFDGSDITGAQAQADGSFVVSYYIPDGTTVGNHTITVYANDNYGKNDTENITVNIIEKTSTTAVSIITPANNATVSSPVTLVANVTGGSVDEVTFSIARVGGVYTKGLTDSSSSGGWSAIWDDGALESGQYSISVSAKKSGTTISGNTIKVSIP